MKQFLSELRKTSSPGIFRKGASLFFQGEIPRHVVIILDGVVKAYTISPDGDETIVNLYGKGSVLPTAWVNDQSPTSLFNYDAVNDVRVLKVSKADFHTTLSSNPAYQQEYLNYMMGAQAALLLRVTGLCQPRAIEKICYTLYFLLFRYGLERGGDNYEIDLKITQSMLASLIGQTRESTAKNLKVLREAGVVDYTSSTYTVNKRRLENYLGEDTFRSLSI